jgi:hypothetical protein
VGFIGVIIIFIIKIKLVTIINTTNIFIFIAVCTIFAITVVANSYIIINDAIIGTISNKINATTTTILNVSYFVMTGLVFCNFKGLSITSEASG